MVGPDRTAIYPDFKVEMRSRRPSCRAHLANHLTLGNPIPDLNVIFGHVTIKRRKAAAMTHNHMIAVTVAVKAGVDDNAVVGRHNPRFTRIGDIKRVMVPNRTLGNDSVSRPEEAAGPHRVDKNLRHVSISRRLGLDTVRYDERLAGGQRKGIGIGKIVKGKVDNFLSIGLIFFGNRINRITVGNFYDHAGDRRDF